MTEIEHRLAAFAAQHRALEAVAIVEAARKSAVAARDAAQANADAAAKAADTAIAAERKA